MKITLRACVHIKMIPWKFRLSAFFSHLPVKFANFLKSRLTLAFLLFEILFFLSFCFLFEVYCYGLFILPVKFTQNRQIKQLHFCSTGKIACRLSKSIVGWNSHMARSWNRKILSGFCGQWEGVSAVQVMQWFSDSHHKNSVMFSKTRYM